MTQEEFEKLVNEGIKAVPEKFLKRLNNIDIVIEDEPTSYQLEKLKVRQKQGLMILGLYEGVPQTKRWHYGQVLPDKITIFKNPIERIACSRQRRSSPKAVEQEIKEIVKNTIWHEIAHHFGSSEKRIEKAENLRRNKNNFS